MKTIVLQGPFLTRTQAAGVLGISKSEIQKRAELLSVSGLIQECYFEFQCRSDPVAKDLGRIVLALRGLMSDLEIADWLIRQSPALEGLSPLAWLERGLQLSPVLAAGRHAVGGTNGSR